MGASSCGRFCKTIGKSLAFTHIESECYCHKRKQTEGKAFTIMNGAQYYSKLSLSDESNCNDHRYKYFTEINVCFKLYENALNWKDANEKCMLEGSQLITLDSAEKLQNFQNILHYNTFYWIGLEDLNKDGVWQWTNKKSVDINSTLWYPREPNFTHELCGCFQHKSTHQYGLYNCNCISEFAYICEM
ncbi:C-type lectin domain family 4 member A-like [Saccostrea cucullata]|uniref:C-type lectin domain family 4 member A-like n=1 Tax=Saccostrea cuccullata TaxID=36930 RepID=UPI002ECFC60A